jgi:hypothetical protein
LPGAAPLERTDHALMVIGSNPVNRSYLRSTGGYHLALTISRQFALSCRVRFG